MWQPIDTCPIGVRVLLLNKAGIAQVGKLAKRDGWFVAWAPIPPLTDELKEFLK